MKKDCPNCKNNVPVGDKYSPCFGCIVIGDGSPSNWEPSENYKHMTNADRIRAMSDEELAEFLAEEAFRIAKPVFDAFGWGVKKQVVYSQKLKWLKQPAEE